MNTSYVAAAYAVFAIVMAWDYVAPRVRLSRVRRSIMLRAQREAARNKP